MKTAVISETEKLQKENRFLRNKIAVLSEQIEWFKRQIFGQRSERIIDQGSSEQLEIEGIEKLQEQPAKTTTVPAHQRQACKRNGQDAIQLPENLPVETTTLDLPEEEKVCKETGTLLVQIGEEVTRKLAHKPGSYFIKEIIRPKYAMPNKEEAGIFIEELPSFIIPKCRGDESLLAEVVTRKFADHLPLYRISEIMGRDGIGISRKLLSQWVVRLGATLSPLYNLMLDKILDSKNIFIDESPVKIQQKKKCSQGYMWTIVGGEGSNPPYRVYDFRENRRHDNVKQILGNYDGVLHSDKYGAYEEMAKARQIIWCPCFAHIRRKFFEAETGDPPFRDWMLRSIKQLFVLEEKAWLLLPDERLKIRQEIEVPLIDEMIEKVNKRLYDGAILPKSKFKGALGYFSSLVPYLKNYTQHADARIDNNVAERAIRPLAIGRKNWLFFGSAQGGRSAATLLSLVQTCRNLNINPREYLEDIFRRFMDHNSNRLDELLPDQWSLSRH